MPVWPINITIPANTSQDNPLEKELEVEGDYLTKIEVLFPSGCTCLAGLQVRYGAELIVPAEEGTWLVGDNETVRVEMTWPLPERKAKLTFLAYNEDELYPHTLYIRVFTKWEREMEPRGLWARVLKALLAFFERVVGVRPGGGA